MLTIIHLATFFGVGALISSLLFCVSGGLLFLFKNKVTRLHQVFFNLDNG